MASIQKLQANRENAKASTGPRSIGGKRRSSQNSRSHGLSIPLIQDPAWSDQVRALAVKFVAGGGTIEAEEIANSAAAAHLDVLRVRIVRNRLLKKLKKEIEEPSPRFSVDEVARDLASRCGSKRPAPKSIAKAIVSEVNAEKFGPDVTECISAISKLDRYERRALSRRRRLMRELEKAVAK